MPKTTNNMSNTLASTSQPDYSTIDLINNPSKYESKLLKEKKERRLSALDNLRETGTHTYQISKYNGFNTNIQERIPL